jgi:transcriptional activator of cad operon
MMLRIGEWCVDEGSGQISRNGETARPDTRTMRLLLFLANHPGEVVSIDEVLSNIWPDVAVTPDSVYQSIASLRRLLGDNPKQPTYIATVPRLGYRLVATVSPWAEQTNTSRVHTYLRSRLAWATGAALGLVLGFGLLLRSRIASGEHKAATVQSQKSVAVLPFLDLTQTMNQEPFADGMTEELIDKLSKVPGFRVPSPTASFYFKRKQLPVADIAKALGVVYVLDGSVRKSGASVRVAARLIRADNGYVIWSATYNRLFNNILAVQDDIAGDVTKALTASIVPRGDVNKSQ